MRSAQEVKTWLSRSGTSTPTSGPERVAALSGPNLAREIAEEQPAATVIACPDDDRASA